jgi:hypothetical protein
LRRSRYAADFSLWQDSDAYQEVLGYLLKELSMEEEPSDCLEEFNIKDDLPGATERINSRNMRQEFRAERRQFC